MDPARWGIDEGYEDMHGNYRRAPQETIAALLDSMRARVDAPGRPAVEVVEPGKQLADAAPSTLHLEAGGSVEIQGSLPSDVPMGYHRREDSRSGESNALIVVPHECYMPPGLRAWGWALQLYALRSQSSWGMGDLGDLARFGRWAAEDGAGFCLINPLHSTDPHHDQASPYFAGSRVWRNPLYIAIEQVEGANELDDDLQDLKTRGRALNHDRKIDRTEIYQLKEAALSKLWRRFQGDPDFDRFCAASQPLLDAFAAFLLLADRHGSEWHRWPDAYRRADHTVIARLIAEHPDRSGFVKWKQWLLHRQLRKATESLPVVGDLAVGVNRDGFDAWYWQDVFASGVTVGAPPDDFNLEGQGWGVLPFDPHRLRAVAYEPFSRMLRSALEFSGGVRLDHVMGMWRLFWIPNDAPASAGAYVRYPVRDLLGIVALESHRARAFVIGEDLGTVERHIRAEMAARAMLSYRILYFEDPPPENYPIEAFAAVTNHDLPTLAGLWTGVDLQAQAQAGAEPNVDFATRVKQRIGELIGVPPDAPASAVIPGVYERIARAPSRLVAATLEDALGVQERPNQPGTTTEHPNWSLALPVTLDDIERHPGARALARLLRDRKDEARR